MRTPSALFLIGSKHTYTLRYGRSRSKTCESFAAQQGDYVVLQRLVDVKNGKAVHSHYKNRERFSSTMQVYLALAWLLRIGKS